MTAIYMTYNTNNVPDIFFLREIKDILSETVSGSLSIEAIFMYNYPQYQYKRTRNMCLCILH